MVHGTSNEQMSDRFGLGSLFETWEQFEQAFNRYCNLTRQNFSISSSGIKEDSYKFFNYTCIYHQDPEHLRKRGKDVRKHSNRKAEKCPVTIRVNLSAKTGLIVVTKFETDHTHPLTEDHGRNQNLSYLGKK